jgi:hypothetical protein
MGEGGRMVQRAYDKEQDNMNTDSLDRKDDKKHKR